MISNYCFINKEIIFFDYYSFNNFISEEYKLAAEVKKIVRFIKNNIIFLEHSIMKSSRKSILQILFS